jgi:hypothetical protein
MLPVIVPILTAVLFNPIVAITPDNDTFRIKLKNNSFRHGSADPSTDERALRLRTGEPDAYIVFAIPWDQIELIQFKSMTFTPDSFSALRHQIRAAEQFSPDPSPLAPHDREPISSRPLWQSPVRPGPAESQAKLVQFIELDAVAANWDQDAAWDGILLRIWPHDQEGRVVQVSGTLTAELVSDLHQSGTVTCRLGHWVRAVRSSDYGPDGFSLRLPYQAYTPERLTNTADSNHDIGWLGDVHVRFAVPGHGVFRSSTATPIRLRRFSPARDRLLRGGWSRSIIAP